MSPDEFTAFVASEIAKWSPVAKRVMPRGIRTRRSFRGAGTNLGFTRDWRFMVRRSAIADLRAREPGDP